MGTLDGAMAVETSGNGGCPVVDVDRNCKRNNDKSDDKPTGYKRHVTYLLQPVAHV
ncbi:MAG: hypothetical protein K2X10_12510 [Hyphomicrobiales bacterium]|nr:hypothetical protein [Hyphomicrobiales bacterium]